jgi:hypothetical protein
MEGSDEAKKASPDGPPQNRCYIAQGTPFPGSPTIDITRLPLFKATRGQPKLGLSASTKCVLPSSVAKLNYPILNLLNVELVDGKLQGRPSDNPILGTSRFGIPIPPKRIRHRCTDEDAQSLLRFTVLFRPVVHVMRNGAEGTEQFRIFYPVAGTERVGFWSKISKKAPEAPKMDP